MGSLSSPLPQGPRKHCGKLDPHDKHSMPDQGFVHGPEFKNTWCDGVPPLGPFVELLVRVPLGNFGPEGVTHAELMRDICDEGIGTYAIEPIGNPGVSVNLRVRTVDGVDRVYPVKRGVPEGQSKLW